jgi:hypothetical protein
MACSANQLQIRLASTRHRQIQIGKFSIAKFRQQKLGGRHFSKIEIAQ